MHRQLWPWLPCLREELIKESEMHRLLHLLRLGHRTVHVIGCLYSTSLGSEMHRSQLPIWFAWVFHCNRQSSRKKSSTNQKKPKPSKQKKNHKKTEKQHHSLKLQAKASKFNSDKLFTWSRHYLPLDISCHLYSPLPLFPPAWRLFFFSCPCRAQGIFSINPFSVTGSNLNTSYHLSLNPLRLTRKLSDFHASCLQTLT